MSYIGRDSLSMHGRRTSSLSTCGKQQPFTPQHLLLIGFPILMMRFFSKWESPPPLSVW